MSKKNVNLWLRGEGGVQTSDTSITVEAVQRRATKLVPGLAELSYGERLRALKLPSLKYRHLRNDMLRVYKLLHKDYDVICNYLNQAGSTRTRGHSLKLKKMKPRLDIRKNYFGLRVVDNWNSLPENVVISKDINIFKGRLDKVWCNKMYLYDE